LRVYGIVPPDLYPRAQIAQEVEKVEGETVIIVDQQDHGADPWAEGAEESSGAGGG
jgi:hypothetical protein